MIVKGSSADFTYTFPDSYYSEEYGSYTRAVTKAMNVQNKFLWTGKLSKADLPPGYFVMQHNLYYQNPETYIIQPLVTLALKKQYLFTLREDAAHAGGPLSIPVHKLAIIVDRSCSTNENHLRPFRSINEHYINSYAEHIDVVKCDLMERCFKPIPIVLPTFKTFTEKLENLNRVNRYVTEAFVTS